MALLTAGGALEKWSCPLTCVPLKAVFACRDCKFSVVERLNRQVNLKFSLLLSPAQHTHRLVALQTLLSMTP
ncbi:hypothetical protein GAYE_SCF13G3389 [Galdieria yellowstonensis]|uniref:Uncharacterized protein n=1 Tax=Galdieria yellowstonensis TaxID=3028027 RepID=A0AAV9IDY3_9RHOD|nr:hypothetical protein GAYE_SCF13G3389 [Galdieria yellowstonensis]